MGRIGHIGLMGSMGSAVVGFAGEAVLKGWDGGSQTRKEGPGLQIPDDRVWGLCSIPPLPTATSHTG